jgi:hypothetical protein
MLAHRRTLALALAATLALFASASGVASADVLAGDPAVAPTLDSDAAGLAEAFRTSATASGAVASLNVYLDASSKATAISLGLYADASGHPGALLAQGSLSHPAAGAWNAVTVPSTSVSAGTTYWLAMLGTGGMLAFRDHCCGTGTPAENAKGTGLSTLPATWTSGAKWSDGSASLYAASSDSTPPPPPPPPPPPETVGQWSPLMSWPLVAAHSILMHTGKVLTMDGWVAPNPTQVFDPATSTTTQMLNPFGLDIFCSGNVTMADGRVAIVGGHGFNATLGIDAFSIFDPETNTWTAGPKMAYPRWYPTVTELGDGRLVAISGNRTDSTWADTPEVYDPRTNSWTALTSISTSQVHEEEYPLSYLLPNGRIFTIASSVGRSFELDPDAPSWTAVGGTMSELNGSAAMYRPGKILYSGGGTPLDSTAPAVAGAQTIDLTAASPSWTPTATMHAARYAHTLTVLPDGKVLAVGGGTNLNQSDSADGELSSEEWDPATGQWTKLASMDAPRVYHSTAVLMPDARVLVAGGGHAEGAGANNGEFSAQYYSPPYLFNGPRPTITDAPGSAQYGDTITVQTPDADNVASVALVSLGADTHTLDMNQHFVPLSFTRGSGSLSVDVPSSPSLAPPGYYMLFIVNGAGVPSTAPFIKLAGSTAPPAVSVTVPDSGAALSGGAVTLTANASDPAGIASVQFTVDGAPVGPKLTSAPYTMSWDSTTVANGDHTIGAVATNGLGITGSASGVPVTVTNTGPVTPTVDVQTSMDGRGGGQTTLPFSTTSGGDVLVAFATADGPSGGGQTLTVSGGGLTWSLVKRQNAQLGTTEIWTAKATGTLSNVTVTAAEAKGGYAESLTVMAFARAGGIGASAGAGARTGAPTVSLTTTAAGSAVYGAGNDYSRAVARTIGSGQALVHQWLDTQLGDTYWVQARTAKTAAAGTTATINDTAPTNDRWNLAAVEIVPKP